MAQKTNKMQSRIYIMLILGLVLGFLIGVTITMKASQNTIDKVFDVLDDAKYDSYNLGWDECKDSWTNFEINRSSDCFYELNEAKTQRRFVCGQFATWWEDLK